MREQIKQSNKELKILKFLLPLIFLIYFKYSFSEMVAWREDESVTLWLALVNNLFDSPFGNVSSTGLPNPNLSVIISKFLIIFNSLITVSFVIAIFQMFIIYFAFYSKNSRVFYNIIILWSSPQVDFLNKIRVFALKYPQKSACGGLLLFFKSQYVNFSRALNIFQKSWEF